MARLWNTFTAPDGRKYYYNSLTKESTWERPESFSHEGPSNAKRAKLVSEIEPFYVIPLLNDWYLVIGDTGAKFYYNSGTEESAWRLADAQSVQLLSAIDKDKLVVLIAIARGYDTEISDQIYNEVIHEVEVAREALLLDEQSQSATEDAAGGLVTAYSSSDEEEEEEEEEEEQEEQEEEEEGEEGEVDAYSYDIDVFNNLDDDDQQSKSSDAHSAARETLFSLFDKYCCDPYSAWSIQARKIQADPDFLKSSDDSLREEIFEDWCQLKVNDSPTEGSGHAAGIGEEESQSSDDDIDLEPLKFHYLAHIVSKSTITPTTIFLDIKDEKKSDFKKYKIKQFVENKRLQESFVSKLLFYYKKVTEEERRNVFRETLSSHQPIIKENLHRNLDKVRRALEQVPDLDDAYAVETRLLEMESWMGVSSSIPILAEDPKYYVLGIKDKMMEIMQYIKDIL